MKYLKIIVALCTILAFLPKISFTQNSTIIDINAIVVGVDNEPIKGAVVRSRAVDASAVTDDTGAFTIRVPDNSILVISATRYHNTDILATESLNMISLKPDVNPVQLAFRTSEQHDVLGGVSVINVADLMRKGFTRNPLDGIVSEIGGFNGNSIWGMGELLVFVDGIPRSLDNIMTSEIEQITVLKGAGAVALYGTHAVNGVILITTKRGVVGEQRIDVRVNSGLLQPIRFPNYLGSSDYLRLYTEARINDGIAISQRDVDSLARFIPGRNYYRFPELDLYSSEFIKNSFNRSDVTAEIYGGDKNARYYTNIGYIRQGSLLNFGEGANSYEQRFNIRGNVDMNLNDWLSARVDAAAIFSEGRGPQTNFWEQAATVRPNQFSPLLPVSMIDMENDVNRGYVETTDFLIDGKYILGGTGLAMTNPIADVHGGGYNKSINRQVKFNTNIDADLGGIAEGLAFRTKIGIDYSTSYNQGFDHEYRVFEPIWRTVDTVDIIQTLTPIGTDNRSSVQYLGNSNYEQLMYFSGQFDYRRSFNERHNLFTMLVANAYQYSNSGVYHRTNNTNLGYFLGYNFMNKYYAEFNSSLMYTTRLAPGNRISLSPVLSLGWRISEEAFMEGVTAVDHLEITSTIGRIYSDFTIAENYLYSSRFNYRGTNWVTWGAEMGTDVTASLRGANPDLKAPHRDELSVGFEATLFNRFLDVKANYFSIVNGGGIIQATTLFPNYLMTGWPASSFVPFVNYNEEKRTGFDFNIRLNQQIGNVDLSFGVAGTFYDTEILKRSDIYEYPHREREGRAIDGVWGLQNAGFFADQADISASPRQTFGVVRPGDIKYVDQNGDDVIDINDEVFLGRGGWFGSPNTVGVNLTAKWNNFTIYAQGVGRWGAYGMRSRTTDWVFGERKYSDVVLGRWAHYTHPVTGEIVDTRETATFPRLTTSSGENNFRVSDFWHINSDRFDISRIQITYSLPKTLLGNSFIKNIEIYAAGVNLLTIAPEREYLETNVGQAPQMRFYNFGITAGF